MNARLHATSPLGDADLVRADQAHYMHGYHVFDDHRVNGSLNIAAGDGAYIYDTAGNRYLDAVGGMWCTNIGLGREEMARTVAEQTRLLAYSNPFCDMANPRAIELCRKLAELAPGDLDHVFLTTGGSTAVDTAIRLMHYYQNCRGISDEVVTSFGRLGHFFASQAVFGVQPDIILTAKGLTSGYQPLGACIFSRRIWEVIAEPDKGRCFSHGFTYSGHPVACAAALKNIEIIEREGLLAHADEVGRYFEERLQSLRDLPIVGDVRGMRFMACVEFVADKASKALFPESLNIGEWVHLRAQKRGLLVRPIVHLNVMSPPLILTREQVDTVVRVLRESIEETVEDLVRAGHR